MFSTLLFALLFSFQIGTGNAFVPHLTFKPLPASKVSIRPDDSIPERGLHPSDLDTDDIRRGLADVEAPEDAPHSKDWGFKVMGPKITKGHLIDKDENTFKSLERRHEKWDQPVEVHEISNVDPITMTALVFLALAVNFIIFAQMGDLGLSTFVASVGNYIK